MIEPKATQHEHVVLAGMMNDQSVYYDTIAEIGEEHFSSEELKSIYRKLVELGSVTADSLIRAEKNPRQQAFIKTIDGEWTTKSDYEFSDKEVKNTYLKRQLYHTLKKTTTRFNESTYDELVDSLERELSRNSATDDETIVDPAERALDAYDEFIQRRTDPDSAKGIPFSITYEDGSTVGFPSLDRSLNGAYGGDLIRSEERRVGKEG